MATVDWLVYHPDHKVIICKVHGFAVAALPSHLSRQHADLSCKTRNAIVAAYDAFELGRPANADFAYGPANPVRAIDGVTIHKGLACQDFAQCGFLSISRKRLKEHCKAAHRWQVSRADPTHWSRVRLQTFFTVPGSAIHYFCVAAPDGEDKDEDEDSGGGGRSLPMIDGASTTTRAGLGRERELVADITAQWATQKAQQDEMLRVLADGALKHELTNWLSRTGWTEHFTGKDLREIHECSRMPGRDDDELRAAAAAMERLFFRRCVDGLRSMPLMTRLLLANPHQHDPHSRPFGPLQERTSMDRYLIYWTRFVCYCLNVVRLS